MKGFINMLAKWGIGLLGIMAALSVVAGLAGNQVGTNCACGWFRFFTGRRAFFEKVLP